MIVVDLAVWIWTYRTLSGAHPYVTNLTGMERSQYQG